MRVVTDHAYTSQTEAHSYVAAVQRKYMVADGEVQNALYTPPPEDKPWENVPGLKFHWVAVKEEWRDLPAVTKESIKHT